MALCYKDRTFCSAPCKTAACRRNLTPDEELRAEQLGLPVATADFWADCDAFVYDLDRDRQALKDGGAFRDWLVHTAPVHPGMRKR